MTDAAWVPALHSWGIRVASKYTVNDPAVDSDDLLQQAWVNSYTIIAAFATDEDRRKYFGRAIRNIAFSAMRQVRSHRNVPLDDWVPGGANVEATALDLAQLADLVNRAEAGDAFVATALLEAAVGFREAAVALGIDIHTVRTRLSRWRAKEHGRGSKLLLTPAEARAIRAALAAGTRRSHIAARYGVAAATIDRVRLGLTCKEVA